MVEIFLLEQLVTFAKYGTLSRAAEELHITQPALSRSMKKLENEFGVSLFDREKSKIFLNDTGKTAVQYAEKVLEADLEMIERTIAFDRNMRTIVLGSCAALPINTLMPILQERFSGTLMNSYMLRFLRIIPLRPENHSLLLIWKGSVSWPMAVRDSGLTYAERI